MQDVYTPQYRDRTAGPYETNAIEIDQRRWVCMRKRQMPKGSTAAMCGPYTRSEIINLLFSNQLTSKDYVWREGFGSWQSLESVAQLQPPIPIAPRITWNSKALDWDNQEKAPAVATGDSTIIDSLLDAGIVLVCGLFALLVWRMVFHKPRYVNYSAPRAAVTAPRATAPRATAPRAAAATPRSYAAPRTGNPAPRPAAPRVTAPRAVAPPVRPPQLARATVPRIVSSATRTPLIQWKAKSQLKKTTVLNR